MSITLKNSTFVHVMALSSDLTLSLGICKTLLAWYEFLSVSTMYIHMDMYIRILHVVKGKGYVSGTMGGLKPKGQSC